MTRSNWQNQVNQWSCIATRTICLAETIMKPLITPTISHTSTSHLGVSNSNSKFQLLNWSSMHGNAFRSQITFLIQEDVDKAWWFILWRHHGPHIGNKTRDIVAPLPKDPTMENTRTFLHYHRTSKLLVLYLVYVTK